MMSSDKRRPEHDGSIVGDNDSSAPNGHRASSAVDQEYAESLPPQHPEARLVLDLGLAEPQDEPSTGFHLDDDFDDDTLATKNSQESYSSFGVDEVTDEIVLEVPAEIVRLRKDTEPIGEPQFHADDTIALDEPDELLEHQPSLPPSRKAKAPKPPPPPERPAGKSSSMRSASKTNEWWVHFFDEDYLRSVKLPGDEYVVRQCDFIESKLGLEPGASILDVGCGLGVHSIELAARGYAVVGLDYSLPMLSRAAEHANARSQRVNFLHADMREMTFEQTFDGLICMGTSFGYFDEEGNRQVLEGLYRTLKPTGRMLLGVANRDFVVRTQPNVVWFEGEGCLCMEETSFDYITSRLEVKRTLLMEGGRQRESAYALRLYTLHELGNLLHHQGFRVEDVSGSPATPGVFFGVDSPEMLILAERRPTISSMPSHVSNEDQRWEDDTARPTMIDMLPDFDHELEDTGVQKKE